MTESAARRLAWGTFAFYAVLAVTYLAFDLATRPAPGGPQPDFGDVVFHLIPASFAIVAMVILSQQPRNVIGWILMAIGVGWEIGPEAYGEFALGKGLPGAEVAIAVSAATWAPPIGLMGTVLLLRFPNGQLFSARWRIVEWIGLVAIVGATVGIMFGSTDLAGVGYPHLQNPLAIERLKPLLDALTAFIILIPATIIASASSLVIRFRRSRGAERLQLKWLVAAGVAVAVVYLIAMISSINYAWGGQETPSLVSVIQNVAVTSFVLIPIAIGFAVSKHRLYDVDIIINRAVVFTIVVGFITAVYVGVVAGVGAAIGSRARTGIGLPIVATAIVGLAFQPLIARARRIADRVVYGRRATPYEALAAVASPGSAAELSSRVARLAVESTAARRAVMWIRAGQQLRPAAWWPAKEQAPNPVQMSGSGDDLLLGERYVQPLMSGDELLGAISVGVGPGEALSARDEDLLSDLAAQAAIAMDRAQKSIELPTGEVTLLMTDVEGSTALWEEDSSAMAHALADHDALIEEAVSGGGGLLIKSRGEGDSTFSVFVDAREAVAAALAMQKSLYERQWPTSRPIRVRAAIHTGEVQVRGRDYYGAVPNRCARLRSSAHGGQTILSKSTRDAAGNSLPRGADLLDLGAHRLKDLSAPEHVFQLSHPDLRRDFPPLKSLESVPTNFRIENEP